MNEIIRGLPVVLEDNPVEEAVRAQGICDLRRVVARRWQHLQYLRTYLPEDDWSRVKAELKATMTSLMDLYGAEIPFAPDMDQILPTEVMEKVPVADAAEVTQAESSASSQCSRYCLPHEFRWIEMKDGVWTVVTATWLTYKCDSRFLMVGHLNL